MYCQCMSEHSKEMKLYCAFTVQFLVRCLLWWNKNCKHIRSAARKSMDNARVTLCGREKLPGKWIYSAFISHCAAVAASSEIRTKTEVAEENNTTSADRRICTATPSDEGGIRLITVADTISG